jgi:hypothetical protein
VTEQILLFIAAGLVGGAVNAAAGGAKLFVFPLLLAVGLSPLAANATGTMALWPALLPAVWVLRADLAARARTLFTLMVPSLVGALFGALALIWSSESTFLAAIPLLLLIAVGAIVLGDRVVDVMARLFPGDRLKAATGVLLFGVGFYGGYFGAGLGFMLIAVLSVSGGVGLRKANAAKVLFAFCINTTAVVPLAFSGLVDWLAAASVLAGGLLGGYLGARMTQRVSERALRIAVASLGLVLTVSFLIRQGG